MSKVQNSDGSSYMMDVDVSAKKITKKHSDGKIEVLVGKEFDKEWASFSACERVIYECF